MAWAAAAGAGGTNGVEMAMILVTIVVVGLFLMYQVGMSRKRAQESLGRRTSTGRRGRAGPAGHDEQVEQLRRLRAAGKIDERTYYEVLRKLTLGQRGR